MEMFEERFIFKLKSQFYNIVTKKTNLFKYELALNEMVLSIKQLLQIDEVILLKCSDHEQDIMVEATTTKSVNMLNQSEFYYSMDAIQQIKGANLNGWIIPIPQDGVNRILVLKHHDSSISNLPESFFGRLAEECGFFLEKMDLLVHLISEESRYKQLFRVTEKVHSANNMESVLTEIIESLREIYPSFTHYLILSQDYKGYESLPIKEFDYSEKNKSLMKAYVTGTMQIEDSKLEKKSILYAPLNGKQGVYGVLEMITPKTLVFPKSEVEFISLLAKTAGIAIENAQLYEQSKRLIADLQLINETSQRLNANLKLAETMEYMTEQIIHSSGAKEVGFIQFGSKTNDVMVQKGSTSFFFTEAAIPYIDFIKSKLYQDHESIFIGDLKLPLDDADSTIYKSVMAVPMLQADILNGFVIVVHNAPYAFSFDTFKLLKSLIHHSTLALTNTILREELEKMVITDHLTKLYSRNYLDERIKESIKVDGEGTFIIIDIDDFKSINDTYGHQIGDEVIIQVAQIIQANIRLTDIGARWGGEELAIYLPRVTMETGIQIAERLVLKVREQSNPKITISCGVSHWKKEDNDTYNTLFKRADFALYRAKETGKDKVVVQSK